MAIVASGCKSIRNNAIIDPAGHSANHQMRDESDSPQPRTRGVDFSTNFPSPRQTSKRGSFNYAKSYFYLWQLSPSGYFPQERFKTRKQSTSVVN
ncbi:Hypothetical protein NTJ_07437 [Nesidiocoris tenuis]|uniref:Uncharacterized protein n=1 Tax=Nesidiocoris tenuis TaxID=355587 RepID=A0ABN7ARQ9_9HEMI|nr:Hypothetical protein NTJ_07437 [Nesidiocoris tenuis]